MRAVPVTPRQVMFTVCRQCPSLHAEGLRVDNLNKKNIPLTQAVVTDTAKSIFKDLKEKKRGCRGDISSVNTAWFLQEKKKNLNQGLHLRSKNSALRHGHKGSVQKPDSDAYKNFRSGPLTLQST